MYKNFCNLKTEYTDQNYTSHQTELYTSDSHSSNVVSEKNYRRQNLITINEL